MKRLLVVANQTLGGKHLVEELRSRLGSDDCAVHVLVPASAPPGQAVWTEGEAEAAARANLERAIDEFRGLGCTADGEVGDQDPFAAIGDVLRAQTFDEIILSTLPLGVSRWLGQDLVHRVERAYDLPVSHVVGEAEPLAGET